MSPIGIVEATERLYRSLFTAAIGFAVAMAAWGVAIAPFNGFQDHHARSVVLGAVLVATSLAALRYRSALFDLLRREQVWVLLVVLFGVAALWIDGGWRSSYYLASYAGIALAAVTGGLRWSLGCAAILAAGYVGGLAVHGYSWAELRDLKDADSVVANTGGYFIAAYFFAAPVAWLGGYVARINQIAGRPAAEEAPSPTPAAEPVRARTLSPGPPEADRPRTGGLSVREVQVAQLVAVGFTNAAIAEALVLSPRTVQRHIENATGKAGAKNRAELAAIAVREGLVPDDRT